VLARAIHAAGGEALPAEDKTRAAEAPAARSRVFDGFAEAA
jgi:hypothetical protein